MKKLEVILTDYVVKKEDNENLNYNVILFGITTGLEFFIFIMLSFTGAIYLKMVIEYIIFLNVFIVLRSYAGGFHMATYKKCLICSCVVVWSVLTFIKRMILPPELTFITILLISLKLYYVGSISCLKNELEEVEIVFFSQKLRTILKILIATSIILYICNMKKYLMVISLSMLVVYISSEIQQYLNRR